MRIRIRIRIRRPNGPRNGPGGGNGGPERGPKIGPNWSKRGSHETRSLGDGLERLVLNGSLPRLGRRDGRSYVALLLLQRTVLLEHINLHDLIAELGGQREGLGLRRGRLALLLAQSLLDLVGLNHDRERAQKGREVVALLATDVDVRVEEVPHARRLGEQIGHLFGQGVRRRTVRPAELAERRSAEAHEKPKGRAERSGEVSGRLAEGLLRLVL
mmetsp:Transcript_33231/g.76831  ORF Transcript_33231/g.76831 Transcript_33231/m.76831 type:complete len:215 (+) Transcript_33231:197-841(+)